MRYHLVVTGLVQGVGFRPFVEREARKLGLTGSVSNSGGAVHIVVRTDLSVLEKFVETIRRHAPAGAVVMEISVKPVENEKELVRNSRFVILKSEKQNWGYPILPPDFAVCPDCIRELKDDRDRRYEYPFTSCVACGPRYSILKSIPYDRETTSMESFSMCKACQREYGGTGRRHHAQTISCHTCGPQLSYWEVGRKWERREAMEAIIHRILSGGIVAAKGIGGYQYICRPDRVETVMRLRQIKGREEKPFAIMFPDEKTVEEFCICDEEEKKILHSSAAPIVLLHKREGGRAFIREVGMESRFVGAFLPTTPFHVLLTGRCGPLIVTSANQSGEPILWKEEGAWKEKLKKADGIAFHDRQILGPLDDSVTAVVGGRMQMIRRSRGYVPLPLLDGRKNAVKIFAAGGDLKSCFAFAALDRIYPGTYLGDMESGEVQRNYESEKERMERLLAIRPTIYVCDKHPGYFSSLLLRQKYKNNPGVFLMEVQHHHAHAASVMAEHKLTHGIGVIFDGTGYGEDHTIWGGEFLLCRRDTFMRMGHLKPVSICGGDASAKYAWQTASCYLEDAGIRQDEWREYLEFGKRRGRRFLCYWQLWKEIYRRFLPAAWGGYLMQWLLLRGLVLRMDMRGHVPLLWKMRHMKQKEKEKAPILFLLQ